LAKAAEFDILLIWRRGKKLAKNEPSLSQIPQINPFAVDPQGLEGRSEVEGKIGPFSIFADLTKGKRGAKI